MALTLFPSQQAIVDNQCYNCTYWSDFDGCIFEDADNPYPVERCSEYERDYGVLR